jgi:hypothetical protein
MRRRRALFLALALILVFGVGFSVAVLVMEGQRLIAGTPEHTERQPDVASLDDLIDRHVVSPRPPVEMPPRNTETASLSSSDHREAEQAITTVPDTMITPTEPPRESENSQVMDFPPPENDGGADPYARDDASSRQERIDRRRKSSGGRPRPTLHGQVNVVALGGWADVYEGSRPLGRTPRQISLSSGRHVLTLRPFGKTPAKRVVVVVQPNKTVRVVVPVSQ